MRVGYDAATPTGVYVQFAVICSSHVGTALYKPYVAGQKNLCSLLAHSNNTPQSQLRHK